MNAPRLSSTHAGRVLSRSLATLVALALFAKADGALATPNFPGALQSKLQLSEAPPCTVCHETSSGGSGTVTRPFGVALRARGLEANDEDSLSAAVDQMGRDRLDSDGDGTTDLEELARGMDPNTAGGSQESPRYGCGAHVAATGPVDARWACGAMALVGLVFALRRAHRSRS